MVSPVAMAFLQGSGWYEELWTYNCLFIFLMCVFYVQDASFCEVWAFVDRHIKEGEFIVIAFVGEFNGWVGGVNFIHESLEVFVRTCPDDKDVVNISFPHLYVVWGLGLEFWFQLTHK